jgi:hypothetical protein
MRTLYLVPTNITEANEFIRQYHRHHKPAQGGLFAVAAARISDNQVCGVAIIGRPIARMMDNGWTAEVTRTATDGTRNANGILYGAAWRAARALGYKKLITYTLKSESGSSLRAARFICLGEVGGGTWSRENRPRVDKHPLQKKLRWEISVPPRPARDPAED